LKFKVARFLADGSIDMATKRVGYGKNIDKDRCAECGGVVVLVDGPVRRWGKWWDTGEWIHRERTQDAHAATPMRNVAL
jgi:hypothetical protein